jgi:thiol-disulfide isomerase/thioredoxin
LFPVILVGLVAVAIVVALVVAGGDANDPSDDASDQVVDAQVGPVALLGEPLPAFEGDDDPAIDTASPGMEATTFDGEAVTIDPADGTGRMIGFFTHTCPHCQREVPTVVDWIDEGRLPDGVEVVAVSTAVDPGGPNYPPSEWFAREGFEELVLRDDQDVTLGSGFGLTSFPYWVVTNAEGEVVTRASGENTPEQLDELAALAAGS